MAVKQATPLVTRSVSVHGLERGRAQARRRSSRRRVKNMLVSGVMFVIAGAVVGGAGYYLWQFYTDEQREALEDDTVVVDQRDTSEIIDDLEDNPRWNGPGAPAFGVGDEQP